MNQTLRILLPAVLTVGLFGQTPAPAPAQQQQGQRRGMQGGGRMMERFEALGLTDDQKAQAQSIFRDQAQSMRGTGEQMRAAREALSNAVKQNASDAEIDKLAANLGNLMAQNTASSAKAMAKFYQILTPEQRQKFDAQMPRFMGSALRGHGARKAFKKNAA